MKKIISAIIITSLFLFGSQPLYAQQKDSIPKTPSKDSLGKMNDSLNSAILKNFNKKLNEIEQVRIADSITKAKLEKQISSLQNTDDVKKEELQKQLEALKNKELLGFAEKKKQIDSLRHTAKATR